MIQLDYFSLSFSPSNPPIYTSLPSFKFMESFFISYCYMLIIFIDVYMNVSLCTWELCQQRPEEAIRSPGTAAAIGFPKTGFPYVALAVLELAWYTKLALNSLRSTYFAPKCYDYTHAPTLPGLPVLNCMKRVLGSLKETEPAFQPNRCVLHRKLL